MHLGYAESLDTSVKHITYITASSTIDFNWCVSDQSNKFSHVGRILPSRDKLEVRMSLHGYHKEWDGY
ncbi:hypothetical protein J6590_044936 [Homalodisca vitripennis]|nr:hypothetical protein J6590_044936 [Homalodisca vitripennis]